MVSLSTESKHCGIVMLYCKKMFCYTRLAIPSPRIFFGLVFSHASISKYYRASDESNVISTVVGNVLPPQPMACRRLAACWVKESGSRMTLELLLISLPAHVPRTDLLSLASAVLTDSGSFLRSNYGSLWIRFSKQPFLAGTCVPTHYHTIATIPVTHLD